MQHRQERALFCGLEGGCQPVSGPLSVEILTGVVEEVRVLTVAGHEIQLLTVAVVLPHEDDLHAAVLALGSLSCHYAHERATSQMKGVRTWCSPNVLC